MKGANFNGMRTTTYLQHPAAFDVADELGLYVEDEGAFLLCERKLRAATILRPCIPYYGLRSTLLLIVK